MKVFVKWLVNKLRPRWTQGHDDPQTSRHVKKAPRQDADESEVHGRLLADTEDWVSLSRRSSHNEQNGAPATANVPTMGTHLVAGAKNPFNVSKYMPKDTERDQTSSKSDTSSLTRAEPSPQSGSFPQDIKDPEIGQFSLTNYDLPPSHREFKRRDSPSLIQKISPDGHVEIPLDLRVDLNVDHPPLETISERPDRSRSISDEGDHLGPFYDDVYNILPILEIPDHSDHSESKSDTDDHFEPVLCFPDHSRALLDGNGHPQLLREGKNHSEYSSINHTHQVFASDGPDHLRFIWERPHVESGISEGQDLLERKSHGRGYMEPISVQENSSEQISEPIWQGQDDSRRDLHSRGHFDSSLKRRENSAPISLRPDQTDLILQGEHHPEPDSGGPNPEFIQDRQSRPESFKSQNSLMVKDQQRRRRREARLHNLLSRSLQTRARAYEKRSQLRQSRSEISNADEAFMKLVRDRLFQGSQDDLALQESFKKLQDARDRYGPLEETYNEVEEQLNREEYEAKELGNKILNSEIPSPDFDIDSRSSGASETNSEVSGLVREVYHPLYEAYLSRLGDADLCREAIAELMMEHGNLLQAEEKRRRVGTELSPDDQITLENFPAAQAKLLYELAGIEEDVELLRLECAREGLLGENEDENENENKDEKGDENEDENGDENGTDNEGENGVEGRAEVDAAVDAAVDVAVDVAVEKEDEVAVESKGEIKVEGKGKGESKIEGKGKGESQIEGKVRESKVEEINLSEGLIGSADPQQNKYEQYPLLLEKPEEKEDENKSKVLLTDFKEGDVGDRITCWLLHKLRASGLEVELLERITSGYDRNAADTGQWQQEVLNFWFFDSANRPPSTYEAKPSSPHTAFPTSHISDVNKERYQKHFEDDEYLIQLVVSSLALS